MNIILRDCESVWPDLWPQNKCRSLWPIFHFPVILPYILKTVCCMNIILRDCESVWPDLWPQNKCRSLWPIFHGPVILPYILKTFWCRNIILWYYIMSLCDPTFDLKINVGHCDLWTSYFGITRQYDTTFHLKINVGHCDLNFLVHWFGLISWRLFDVWTSYLGIMSQYELTFDLKKNVGHCDVYFIFQWFCRISWRLFDIWTSYFRTSYTVTYISWSSDFALYLGDYLMHEHHTSGLWVSMTDVWPEINVGQCDLYFMSSDFALYLENYSVAEHHTLRLCQYELTSDLEIFVGNCAYISWSTEFALYLEDCSYFVIMSQCNAAFALKQCRSQWFIFSSYCVIMSHSDVTFNQKNVGHSNLNFSWSSDYALYLI